MNKLLVSLSFTLAVTTAAMADKSNVVLVALSGAEYLSLQGGGKHKTGFFLSELTTAVEALDRKGYSIVFSNPTGKSPVIAPDSDSAKWFSSEKEYLSGKKRLLEDMKFLNPKRFDSFVEKELATFAAIYIPGGYAPMEDLPHDKELGRILEHFHRTNKPTALICHGPIALLSNKAFRANGTWAYSGYRSTIVSKKEEVEEEAVGHLEGKQLYYVEEALRAGGVNVEVAKAWTSNVVRDRELITGQNPMSAKALVNEFMKALKKTDSARTWGSWKYVQGASPYEDLVKMGVSAVRAHVTRGNTECNLHWDGGSISPDNYRRYISLPKTCRFLVSIL